MLFTASDESFGGLRPAKWEFLDTVQYIVHAIHDMATYSSRDVARKLGLSPSAMSKYVLGGKIPVPKSVTTGGITVYLWTDEDIEKVRQLLPKIANGRKTRHQKKHSAVSTHGSPGQAQQSRQARDRSAKAKGKTKSKKKK